ncbi:hypothetical protein LAX74_014275 [Listeria marthii]|nr:hypothetical protein [Listeria marthii]UHP12956.1 hypothetical protein LAX74_014275 [Listeria marthii]
MKIAELEEKLSFSEFEVDYYVPASIRFPKNKLIGGQMMYYQFLNAKDSFIEIIICADTKKIVSVTLTSINDIQEKEINIDSFCEGTPIIDLNVFCENRLVIDKGEFNIFKSNKNIYFILNGETINNTIKVSEHLFLFINNKNKIIGANFFGFTKFEWNEIEEKIKNSVFPN